MKLRKFLTNGFSISKNYVFEWHLFWKVRDFSDGITFFNCIINLDLYKSDHRPMFEFCIETFNFIIIELIIHYKWHRND